VLRDHRGRKQRLADRVVQFAGQPLALLRGGGFLKFFFGLLVQRNILGDAE